MLRVHSNELHRRFVEWFVGFEVDSVAGLEVDDPGEASPVLVTKGEAEKNVLRRPHPGLLEGIGVDELIDAMDFDPELAEAFHKLTPGRQRSYAYAIGSAKKIATRIARVVKYRDKILAGKGANER